MDCDHCPAAIDGPRCNACSASFERALALERYADHREALIGIGSPWRSSAGGQFLQSDIADVHGFARSDGGIVDYEPPSHSWCMTFEEQRIVASGRHVGDGESPVLARRDLRETEGVSPERFGDGLD